MAARPANRPRLNNLKDIFRNNGLILEFRTETVKLLIYNLFIVLLIANQEVTWTYEFSGIETAKRFGQEVVTPVIESKFGFFFRMLTVLMNSAGVFAIVNPIYKYREFLMPPILWNFYTIAAIFENMIEVCWVMYLLEVSFLSILNVVFSGFFVLSIHSKLLVDVLRFYDYLNFRT